MHSRQPQGCASRPSATAPQHNYFPTDAQQSRPSQDSSISQVSLGVLSPPLTPEDPYPPTKTRSEHVESGPYGYYPQPTKGAVREGIMQPSSYPASAPTRPIFTFPSAGSTSTVFTFRILPRLEVPLSFPSPSPPLEPRKRYRAVADVDGEHSSLHKKKRRLRLFLITSRLSPQFSHPATNIVDRGSSKIAVWAKQKASGRNILRKAAILNRIRRQSIYALETAGGLGRVLVEQEKEQEQLQLARFTLTYGSHDSATRPVSRDGVVPSPMVGTRPEDQSEPGGSLPAFLAGSLSPPLKTGDEEDGRDNKSPNDAYAHSHAFPKPPRSLHVPLPPSPLGLSNYDALDLEDDMPDPYAHLDAAYETKDDNEPLLENTSTWPHPLSRESDEESSRTASKRDCTQSSILDPDEPVIGDHDQMDESADVIWPTTQQIYERETDRVLGTPSLPFPQERQGTASTPPAAPPPAARSPGFSSSLSPASSSPNFVGLYVTSSDKEPKRKKRCGIETEEEERKRQRHLLL